MQGTLTLTTPTDFQDSASIQQGMMDLITAYGNTFPNNKLNIVESDVPGESAGGATGSLWVATDPAYTQSVDPAGNAVDVSPTFTIFESATAEADNIGLTLYTANYIASKLKANPNLTLAQAQASLQGASPADFTPPQPLIQS